MKPIYLVLSTVFSLLVLSANAQFQLKTEYQYLKLINSQAQTLLIKDNLINAELVASNLIYSSETLMASKFLNELSNSYYLLDNSSLSFYYQIVQRCLFPNDSIASAQKRTFFNNAYALNFTEDRANEYWQKTQATNLQSSHESRISLALQLSIQCFHKDLAVPIHTLGMRYQIINGSTPVFFQHWDFLQSIGMNQKRITEYLNFDTPTNLALYDAYQGKAKIKILSKTFRYYCKMDAEVHAREILNKYKGEKLPLFRKIDLGFKKIRLLII